MAPFRYKPILSTDEKVEGAFEEDIFDQPNKSRKQRLNMSFLFHLVLLVVYTASSYLIIRKATIHCNQMDHGLPIDRTTA